MNSKYEFKLTENKRSCFARININNENIDFIISLEEENAFDRINWAYVDHTIDYIKSNFRELLQKSNIFSAWLVKNSGLYNDDEQSKISGYKPSYIKIIKPFNNQSAMHLKRFQVFFNIDSEFWIDTYGQIAVKFLNDHPVGVERIQV